MTRKSGRPRLKPSLGRWPLQDAKARFSELVRCVKSDGPQHVTVHGRDEVVVVSVRDYQRMAGERTGEALIAAMRNCPNPKLDFESIGLRPPVRPVDL